MVGVGNVKVGVGTAGITESLLPLLLLVLLVACWLPAGSPRLGWHP